jgi:hypothetical protein
MTVIRLMGGRSRSVPVRLISIAGWINKQQQQAIEYLREENKVLREQLGGRGLRFTDEQRRRLAVKEKGLGHRALARWQRSSRLRLSWLGIGS